MVGAISGIVAWLLFSADRAVNGGDTFLVLFTDLPGDVNVEATYDHAPIWGMLLGVVAILSSVLAIYAAAQTLRGRPSTRLSLVGVSIGVVSLIAICAL